MLLARSGQLLVEGGRQVLTGDFDGDGRTDLFFYGPASACDTVWFGRSDGTFEDPREVTQAGFVPFADIGGAFEPVVADFDSDGTADILFANPSTGQGSEVWLGAASAHVLQAPG